MDVVKNRFLKAINEFGIAGLIDVADRVVVGFSGGAEPDGSGIDCALCRNKGSVAVLEEEAVPVDTSLTITWKLFQVISTRLRSAQAVMVAMAVLPTAIMVLLEVLVVMEPRAQ